MNQTLPGWRPRAAGLLILGALALGVAAVPEHCQAADPFYEQRLREGAAALERGDHRGAVRALRLAAFGLLDEPARLAESLVLLALAQAGEGDSRAFEATFQRLVDLEERFGAYSAADLPAATRGRLEEAAVTLLPSGLLLVSPGFSEIAERRLEREIVRLPPRQRRERLTAQVEAQPPGSPQADPRWAILLARLEVEQGRFDAAVEAAGRALAIAPDDPAAFCARGVAHARRDACPDAVRDLERCDRTRVDLPIAHAMLSCLLELGSLEPAQALLAELPPAIAADRSVAKLRRRIDKRAAAAAAQPIPAPAPEETPEPTPEDGEAVASDLPAAAPEPVAQSPAPAVGAAPAVLSPTDRAAIDDARRALAAARVARELEAPLAAATGVADRNPGSREAQYLAAEIAYRMRRWPDAVRYFARGGEPPEERPELLFYLAVSLWESGDRESARSVLAKALPRLRRTPFVESYIQRMASD